MVDWYAILKQVGIPAGFIVGGFVAGVIMERLLPGQLKRLSLPWKVINTLIKSLHGLVFIWIFSAGLYGAFLRVVINPELQGKLVTVLRIVVLLSVTIFFARSISGILILYLRGARLFVPATIFANISKLFIIIIGILVILQSLKISITPILGALGVGGLAVALALQDTLSNLFAGIQIIASRKIMPGDYIKLESGEEGYVTDITWRNSTIKAIPDNMIIVPNARIASTIVTNYYQPKRELAVRIDVGVSYDSDLGKVEEVTNKIALEVMKEVPGGVPDFIPFIRYNQFDDFSINFTVFLRAQEFMNHYIITHEFIKRLHKKYNEEGIVIPFPIRTIYSKTNSRS